MARNSLMEWIQQTRKLSKETDYKLLDVIDFIIDELWLIDPKLLKQHRKIIDRMCDYYHKPHPTEFYASQKKFTHNFRLHHNSKSIAEWIQKYICPTNSHCKRIKQNSDYKKCRPVTYMSKMITRSTNRALIRLTKTQDTLLWQWFEIVDFMFDRPELINPALLDKYVQDIIHRICMEHNKKNPLDDPIRTKFGKYYKDKDGNWQQERRKRS